MKIFFRIFLFIFFILDVDFVIAKELKISASINPIYQIIRQISKDKNSIYLISNSNVSEHESRIKMKDIPIIKESDMIFYIDDSLEVEISKVIKNFSLYQKAFTLSKINNINILQDKYNNLKIDPHIWLNPENGIKIAEFVKDKLCESDYDNCGFYSRNFEDFKKNVLLMAKKIKENLTNKKFNYASHHNGYRYFEEYFKIKPAIIVVENENDQLNFSSLEKLNSLSKNNQINCIFIENSHDKNSAIKLAKNYQIKAIETNILGDNDLKNKNGYVDLLYSIMNSFSLCLNGLEVN